MKKLIPVILFLIASIAQADTVIITKTDVVEATPTISTSAYTAGDQVGGKITLAGAVDPSVFSGVIASVEILDRDSEEVDIDVVFFDTDFTASSDNAAFDPSDTDLLNVVCYVTVADYSTFSDNSVGLARNVNCPFKLTAPNQSLYAALVTRGTPTYTATSDLTLRVGILQD